MPAEAADNETADSEAAEVELRETLRAVQRLIQRYPFAAQALFASLMAEGRNFAATPRGESWAARLSGSRLLTQGAAVWESVTQNTLEDDPEAILPTRVIEAFLSATRHADVEALLRSLFIENEPTTASQEATASPPQAGS